MKVIVLLADGARADWLAAAMDSGAAPALARLRAEGAMHRVTTVFPSVTSIAYAPFLMGRFPGGIGLPGLRWFDRDRVACAWPDWTRSYVGWQMPMINRDVDANAPTIFELVPDSVGAFSALTRGLTPDRSPTPISLRTAIRGAVTHYTGSTSRLMQVDREVSDEVVRRAGAASYVFAAFGSIDKISHALGHTHPDVLTALRIVDDTVAAVREKLERLGTWSDTHLWVTSDHGHSPVSKHEDLERVVRALGHKVIAHPWVYRVRPETAVMVGGNAMAHVYVDLARRERPYVRGMSSKARDLVAQLLARPSVDLLIAAESVDECTVHSKARGRASITRRGASYSYRRADGDPLGLGHDCIDVDQAAAHQATLGSAYPDGIVQIIELACAPRSGDIVLSAAPDWDLRARWEPTPHVSTHGSLRAEHTLVPLVTNRPTARVPRRTTDLFPSALAALGRQAPPRVDGDSFL